MKRHEVIADDIEKQLSHFVSDSGSMPPVRLLATRYHASQKTICEALELLVARNRLKRTAGGGSLVEVSTPILGSWKDSSDIEKRKRSDRYLIGEALQSDILSGVFGYGALLPTTNQLAERYGCSYRTMRGCLTTFLDRGLLSRKGRRYRISGVTTGSDAGSRTIIVADNGYASTENVTVNHILQTIETAHRLAGWKPPRIMRIEDVRMQTMERCGVCICLSREPYEWFEPFSRTYATIPKACIDISERHTQINPRTSSELMIVSPDNVAAGQSVARYLYALGHRGIAVFTGGKIPTDGWLRKRIAGITNVFEVDEGNDTRAVLLEAGSKGENSRREMRMHAQRFKEALSSSSPELTRILGARLRGLDAIDFYCSKYFSLRPLFEAALQDESITAWIGATDEIALLALAFLEDAGHKVPHDISLVGFDDTPDAMRLGLTSYDIGSFGMAEAAFNRLARPSLAKKHIRIPGRLAVRTTCAPPGG